MGNQDSKEKVVSPPGRYDESVITELSRLDWSEEVVKFGSMVQTDWQKFVDSFDSSTPRKGTSKTVTLPKEEKYYDKFFKVVLLGDEQTGKTALLNRYVHNFFVEDQRQTIVFDMDERILKMYDGQVVKLLLLSHGGSESFLKQISSTLKDAVGFVLVYDTTNPSSLTHLQTVWYPQIRKYATYDNCPIFLIGTKQDLKSERNVDFDQLHRFIEHLRYKPMEVSAKEGSDFDINIIFEYIVEVIYKQSLLQQIRPRKPQQQSSNNSETNTDYAISVHDLVEDVEETPLMQESTIKPIVQIEKPQLIDTTLNNVIEIDSPDMSESE